DLGSRLGGMIRGELEQAARQGMAGNERPAVGQTIGRIGQSAVLLLPLVQFGQMGLAVGVPVFVVLAARDVWAYVASRLQARGGAGKQPDNRTPVQYFREQQAATVTPNGKIMIDSVEERNGKLEYKTEDGKKWRVGHSKRADGTYQYGMPEEVK